MLIWLIFCAASASRLQSRGFRASDVQGMSSIATSRPE